MRAPDVIQFEYESYEMRVEELEDKIKSITEEITQKFSEIDELVNQREQEQNTIYEFRRVISDLYVEAAEARAARSVRRGFE